METTERIDQKFIERFIAATVRRPQGLIQLETVYQSIDRFFSGKYSNRPWERYGDRPNRATIKALGEAIPAAIQAEQAKDDY